MKLLITTFVAFLFCISNASAEPLSLGEESLGSLKNFKQAYSWGVAKTKTTPKGIRYTHTDGGTQLEFELHKKLAGFEIVSIRINGKSYRFKPATAAGMIRATISGFMK